MSYEFDKNTGTIIKFLGEEKELVIPSEIDNIEVKKIADRAFANCGLTKVVIPESVKYIGLHAFENNPLTCVTIEGNQLKFKALIWESFGLPLTCMPGVKNYNDFLIQDDEVIGYIGEEKELVIPSEIDNIETKIINNIKQQLQKETTHPHQATRVT